MTRFVPIKGYEELYAINVNGEIKILKPRYKNINFLKPQLNPHGYYYVGLRKSNIRKNYSIHRLIATYFIPNPDNHPCINHKDGNKLNNHLSNLEWCTYRHNAQHAVRTGLNITPKRIFDEYTYASIPKWQKYRLRHPDRHRESNRRWARKVRNADR